MKNKAYVVLRKYLIAFAVILLLSAVVLGVTLNGKQSNDVAEAAGGDRLATALDLAALGYSLNPNYIVSVTGGQAAQIFVNHKFLVPAGNNFYDILQQTVGGVTYRYVFFTVNNGQVRVPQMYRLSPADTSKNPSYPQLNVAGGSFWYGQLEVVLPTLGDFYVDSSNRVYFDYWDAIGVVGQSSPLRYYLGKTGYTSSPSEAVPAGKQVDELSEALVTLYTTQTQTYTYNGSVQYPTALSSAKDVTITYSSATGSGTSSVPTSRDAGTYLVNVQPNSGYVWKDGTSTARTFLYRIDPMAIALPTAVGNLVYNGTTQTGIPSGANYTVENGSGVDAKTYDAKVTPKANYCWEGGSTSAVTIQWAIDKAEQQFTVSDVTMSAMGGSTGQLSPTGSGFAYLPSGYTYRVATGADIVDVDSQGKLTAKGKAGTATVEVTNSGNGNLKEKTVTVNVTTELDSCFYIGDRSEGNVFATLAEAYAAAQAGQTIYVLGTPVVEQGVEFGKNITLTGDPEYGGTIVRGQGCTGSVITVAGGSELSLGSNLTIDGNGVEGDSAISVAGTLNVAGTITGCAAKSNGGAISVQRGGALTLEGSADLNTNSAIGNGGAIYVADGAGTVAINGGDIANNNAGGCGNGVYLESNITLSENVDGIKDAFGIGSDSAQINVSGALSKGSRVTVEFTDGITEQVADSGLDHLFVTSDDNSAQQLKDSFRVFNNGFTFAPTGGDGLTLIESTDIVAMCYDEDGTIKEFTDIQAALDYAAANKVQNGKVYLVQYQNDQTGQSTTEIPLDKTLVVNGSNPIELDSIVRRTASEGTYRYEETSSPTVLKRSQGFTSEMVRVERDGELTIGNVTLDGGAEWGDGGNIRISDDGKGGAGTVTTNNNGVSAHAPVVVNRGKLNLTEGTIQNNDNNFGEPGVGFGSQNYGGGVRNEGAGQFTMTGGSITHCYAREGGGVLNVNKPGTAGYVEDGNPSVTISGGSITDNASQQKGAAVQTLYGGATTTVTDDGKGSGPEITDNWSLHDLGTLAVEEGGSLTIGGGTVSTGNGVMVDGMEVGNRNAVYMYDKYGKSDYDSAPNGSKPFIEGKAAPELTITGSPYIGGSVHIDDPCQAWDANSGKVFENGNYDPFVDLDGYKGGSLTLDVNPNRPSGKLAVGSADNIGALGVKYTDADGQHDFSGTTSQDGNSVVGSYTIVTDSDGGNKQLGTGGFELTVSQSESGKLTVKGSCDPSVTSVTFGDGSKCEVKDGVIDWTIDMSDTTATGNLVLGYAGGSTYDAGEITLSAVLFDAATGNLQVPEGTKYYATDGSIKSAQNGLLPNDIAIDSDGYATFTDAQGNENRILLGKRASSVGAADVVIEDYSAQDGTFSVTFDAEDGLEYCPVDSDGNLVGEGGLGTWKKAQDGKVTFDGLDPDKDYKLAVRRSADGSNAVLAGPYSVGELLTSDEMTALGSFDEKYNGVQSGLWSVGDDGSAIAPALPANAADVKDALDSYNGIDEVLRGRLAQKYADRAAQLEDSYPRALANEWKQANADVLGKAAGGLSVADDKDAVNNAIKSYFTAGAPGKDSETTDDEKKYGDFARFYAKGDYDALVEAYRNAVSEQLQKYADDDSYKNIVPQFVEQANNYAPSAEQPSVDVLAELSTKFDSAKQMIEAYDAARAKDMSASSLGKLAEQYNSYLEQLLGESDPAKFADIVSAATAAFGDTAQRGVAEQKYVESYADITGKQPDSSVTAQFDNWFGGIDSAADYNKKLGELLSKLIDEQSRSFTSQAAKDYADKCKQAVASAASASDEVADFAQHVTNLYAVEQYLESYENIVGAPADLTDSAVKQAIDAIVAADEHFSGANFVTYFESVNAALAEQVGKLLDGNNIDSLLRSAARNAVLLAVSEGNRTSAQPLKVQNVADVASATRNLAYKQQALAEYCECYEDITGAAPSQAAKQAFADKLAAGTFNETLRDEVLGLLDELLNKDGDGNVIDSAEAQGIVSDAVDGVNDLADKAAASGSIANLSEAVQGVKEALDAQRSEEKKSVTDLFDGKDLSKLPEDLRKQAQDIVDQAKRDVEQGNYNDYPLIEEKFNAKIQLLEELAEKRGEGAPENMDGVQDAINKGLSDIDKAESADDVARALDDASLNADKEYAKHKLIEDTASDSEHVKQLAEAAVKAIEEAASSDEIDSIVDEVTPKIEGERFLDGNEVLRKDFDDVTASDKDALNEVKSQFGGLDEQTKQYLDGKFADEGYGSAEGAIDDRIASAQFEQKKADLVQKANDQLLNDCTGEYVQSVFDQEVKNITDTKYQPCTDDSARSGHLSDSLAQLDGLYDQAKQHTDLAKAVQRAVNQAQQAANDRIASGVYNDEQSALLGEIVEQLQHDAERVPAQGANGKTAQEMLDELLQGAMEDMAKVPVTHLTVGDIKPDKQPSVSGGTGDYTEDSADELWGIVTGDKPMPGDAELTLGRLTREQLDQLEQAIRDGKFAAATGSQIPEDVLKRFGKDHSLLDGWRVKASAGELPDGMYTVKVLLPEDLRGVDNLQIVLVDEQGVAHVYETTVEDGKYLVFVTDAFGDFAVMGERVINLWWLIILLSVLLAPEVVFIIIFARRRNDKRSKTYSFAPILLLASFVPDGAVVTCIVLGVCVAAAAAVLIVIAVRKRKRKGGDDK